MNSLIQPEEVFVRGRISAMLKKKKIFDFKNKVMILRGKTHNITRMKSEFNKNQVILFQEKKIGML